MPDEAEIGSAGAPDRQRHSRGSSGEQSPLQARAAFLKNRSWELVTSLNRAACTRGGAKYGQNSESHAAVAAEWESSRQRVLSLDEAIEFLRQCHRRAPFLFFNGNTFADVGRTLVDLIFAEMPITRRRELMSAVAHYIAGVLDKEVMHEIVDSLTETADWKTGDRVKSLRGTTRGIIVRLMEDGRVVWKPNGSNSELMALPESLVRDKQLEG
jgi:hypothetical protein